MKYRLPVLLEHTVREAESNRQVLATQFEATLRTALADNKHAITCTKGCNHCCHYPRMLSLLEGVSLFRWLSDHSLWRKGLQDKFREAHRRVWGLAPSVWLLSSIPCPLLSDEGLCEAYEGRPFVCRTTVSTGDPYYCHPHRFTEGGNGIVSRREVEATIHDVESRLMKAARFTLLRVPLATAVLMGEQLCKEGLDPEDISEQLFEDWARSC